METLPGKRKQKPQSGLAEAAPQSKNRQLPETKGAFDT